MMQLGVIGEGKWRMGKGSGRVSWKVWRWRETVRNGEKRVDAARSAELSVISEGIYCLICRAGDSSHVLRDG